MGGKKQKPGCQSVRHPATPQKWCSVSAVYKKSFVKSGLELLEQLSSDHIIRPVSVFICSDYYSNDRNIFKNSDLYCYVIIRSWGFLYFFACIQGPISKSSLIQHRLFIYHLNLKRKVNSFWFCQDQSPFWCIHVFTRLKSHLGTFLHTHNKIAVEKERKRQQKGLFN